MDYHILLETRRNYYKGLLVTGRDRRETGTDCRRLEDCAEDWKRLLEIGRDHSRPDETAIDLRDHWKKLQDIGRDCRRNIKRDYRCGCISPHIFVSLEAIPITGSCFNEVLKGNQKSYSSSFFITLRQLINQIIQVTIATHGNSM